MFNEAAFYRKRRWIILSYWFFVLIALPIWWKTTEIRREKLPLTLMERWEKGQMCNFQFDIPVVIDGAFDSNDTKVIVEKIRKLIARKQKNNVIKLHIKRRSNKLHYIVKLREKKNIPSAIFNIYQNRTLFIDYNPNVFSELPKIVSKTLLDIFSSSEEYIKFHLRKIMPQHYSSISDGDIDIKAVKYSSSFDIVFSLINGGEKDVVLFWDIQNAIHLYFEPLLKQLSIFSKFNLQSQIQFCAELTFNPHKLEQENLFYISMDQFPEFVNFAEWNLATTLSLQKTINFLIYIPQKDIQPLFLKDSSNNLITTNSFLVPQWGSIVIYNQNHTDKNSISHLNITQLRPIFHIFVSNFLTFLGVPSLPSNINLEPLPVLNAWKLDGLYRQRITENIVSASATLGSLARLVRQIPNMAVPYQVQHDVLKTMEHLKMACQNLNDFQFFYALKNSSIAVDMVEKAFFNPSMVSMLYFPDEHKYGVYLPLFGPLFFPLIISLIREIKSFFHIWQKKKQKKKHD